MINSIKLIGEPEHAFNYLSEYSRNKQVQKLYGRLEDGIEFTPGNQYDCRRKWFR